MLAPFGNATTSSAVKAPNFNKHMPYTRTANTNAKIVAIASGNAILIKKYVVKVMTPIIADAPSGIRNVLFISCFYNSNFKTEKLGMSKKTAFMCNIGIKALEWFRSPATKAFKASKHFDAPADIKNLAEMAKEIVSLGNQTGEGWFLTGEMLELIHNGASNIVCTQPFACLPNHIVGKGVIKELRRRHPEANIVAIDYDPGASEVNQLNRIKLMLSTANKHLEN